MSSPLLEYPRGPRLSLREFRPDDLLTWQRIAGDPRVAAHTPWPALATPDTAGAWLSETARMAQLQPRRSFYLAVEQYGDLIGSATLDILSFPHRQGEIGIYLRPDRWGEALGTETARVLLEFGFSRLGLHRIQATTDPENTAAQRVLEHVKMRMEGVLLDRYLVAGQWRDRAMFAITMPEWRGQPRRGVPDPEEAASEPLVGEMIFSEHTVPEDEVPVEEPAEPQVLRAEIRTEQIEVVEIRPQEP